VRRLLRSARSRADFVGKARQCAASPWRWGVSRRERWVGDDVVDLSVLAEGKERDARFTCRVLAAEERALLAVSAEPGLLLWLLWAAKEAAYKVGRKCLGEFVREGRAAAARELVFAHAGFVVRPDLGPAGRVAPWGQGSVVHERFRAHFRWQLGPGYLHVVAVDGSLDAAIGGVKVLTCERASGTELSHAARVQALELLVGLGLDGCTITAPDLSPMPRPPRVRRAGRYLATYDVSLSHDGRFASAAIIERRVNGSASVGRLDRVPLEGVDARRLA